MAVATGDHPNAQLSDSNLPTRFRDQFLMSAPKVPKSSSRARHSLHRNKLRRRKHLVSGRIAKLLEFRRLSGCAERSETREESCRCAPRSEEHTSELQSPYDLV